MKKEMRNIMKDVAHEADKVWKVQYEGHQIEVINKMSGETLVIDGEIIDHKKRSSLLAHLIPHSKLSGTLTLHNGQQKSVFVKVGGYLKFNCQIKIDGKKVFAASEKFEMIPWKNKEKITPFIQQQLQENGKLVTDELPDDDYIYDENYPRVAPGLADQLIEDIPTPFFVKKLIKLFEAQMQGPTDKTRAATYEAIKGDQIASYIELFIEQLEGKDWDDQVVQREAQWLLENAADREVVKFAIVMLGCTDCDAYRQQLIDIGQHEEFTTYVVFALDNGCENGNDDIWQLAKDLQGWGRLVALQRLKGTTPEIQQWFLTEGYKNNVLHGYSASECVVEGKLNEALAAETISKELYGHANELLQAFFNYRAASGNMEDYADAYQLLDRFIHHAKLHCTSLVDFYPLTLISAYLEEDEAVWVERCEEQWTESERAALKVAVAPFIDDRKWLLLVVDELDENFHQEAFKIAKFYGLDVTGKVLRQLKEEPSNPLLYAAVMESENKRDVEDLCLFANEKMTADALWKEEEACVRAILEDLYLHEGVGIDLLHTALKSTYSHLQNEALTTLASWPPVVWKNDEIMKTIKEVAKNASAPENRQIAKELLK